ncbi:uroporphyrinogen-III C-methyltransferase [Stackebrandtia soli]|uniref:uroporphyrinogen-III C-methyltransferase n=1 Tax=Stackebrandtia soli TaxID=1892856 RepID=UPI0039ED75C7
MYPLGLRLSERDVLVVGGGNVAHRRVPRLIDAGARVHLVAPTVHISLEALADAGAITWHRRGYQSSDMDGKWLALAAADDPTVNITVSADADDHRVFCVRADDADAATAWTPAVARSGRLTVACFADADPRRSAALAADIADRLDTGELAAPVHRPRPGDATGTVTLVGAGPGDPELITVAGHRALRRADVVVTDRLGPAALLEDLPPHVDIVDVGKIPYGRQATQDDIIDTMIDAARDGKTVVRLKGGDGFVFGRGGEELDALVAAGLPVHVIPGVSSGIAAPALAGIPVTERGIVHDFTVVSGHLAPGDPAGLVNWDALGRSTGTLVLLMAVRHLRAITSTLIESGRDPRLPAVAIMDASTTRQRVVRSTLGVIAEVPDVTAPAVVVIGEVARERGAGSVNQ